jgi:hypothetical protein
MHPGTRFVRAKSVEQQDMDHLALRREGWCRTERR